MCVCVCVCVIESLKPNKAYGQDLILNENYLFNAILQTGEYPDMWSTGHIVPIHKKGDPIIPKTIGASP